MQAVILGCGTSGGVPRIGGEWGACDPNEPRNQRLRPSIVVESGGIRVLVDTSPDLRAQCLACRIDRIDAVLYTHAHADHTHGLDDLRMFAINAGRPVDVHADAGTLHSIEERFRYAFNHDPGGLYPPILTGHRIDGPIRIGGMTITSFPQNHGAMGTLGFRFGPIAYSTDVHSLPEESFVTLQGVTVWIVDALRHRPHPTHASVAQALSWIERVKPVRAVLTHMSNELDYSTLAAALPQGVEPGYDGMVIEV